jgi:hypothetical protein
MCTFSSAMVLLGGFVALVPHLTVVCLLGRAATYKACFGGNQGLAPSHGGLNPCRSTARTVPCFERVERGWCGLPF